MSRRLSTKWVHRCNGDPYKVRRKKLVGPSGDREGKRGVPLGLLVGKTCKRGKELSG